MSLYAETSGHFVDRTVGKITDLERGDQVADAVASGIEFLAVIGVCLLYTSPSPRDRTRSRMPSSA